MGVGQNGRVSEGPWEISPDVAWVSSERVLVLDLRPPHGRPWRLTDSAAIVWECVAAGLTFAEILAEFAEVEAPGVADDIRTFLDELTTRAYISPRGAKIAT